MTEGGATSSSGSWLLKLALINVALLLGLVVAISAKEHMQEPLIHSSGRARMLVDVDEISASDQAPLPASTAAEEVPVSRLLVTDPQEPQTPSVPSNGTAPAEQLFAAAVPKYPERLKAETAIQESLQDPPGVCPKLNLTEESPLGGQPESNPMCRAFLGKQRIAIVGNGPLPPEQRGEIETADVVVRFNLMNNWKRMQERLDVWITRFHPAIDTFYWGFTFMSRKEARDALGVAQAVFLVGGRQEHADSLVRRWPYLLSERSKPLLLPEEPIYMAFWKKLGVEDNVPSSGFMGIMIAQHCSSQDAVISLYGFNWSPENWEAHNMDVERRALQEMEKDGKVVIHPTACTGMRECGAVNFDNSCHWSPDRLYLCLQDGKWVDMAAHLPAERRNPKPHHNHRP